MLGAPDPFDPRHRLVYESRLAAGRKVDCVVTSTPPTANWSGCLAAPRWTAIRRAHSKPVETVLPKLEGIEIALSNLTAYRPMLNRIEPEWHALKSDRLQGRSFTTGTALEAAVDAALDRRTDRRTRSLPGRYDPFPGKGSEGWWGHGRDDHHLLVERAEPVRQSGVERY